MFDVLLFRMADCLGPHLPIARAGSETIARASSSLHGEDVPQLAVVGGQSQLMSRSRASIN
jgi:hypothetical protein